MNVEPTLLTDDDLRLIVSEVVGTYPGYLDLVNRLVKAETQIGKLERVASRIEVRERTIAGTDPPYLMWGDDPKRLRVIVFDTGTDYNVAFEGSPQSVGVSSGLVSVLRYSGPVWVVPRAGAGASALLLAEFE